MARLRMGTHELMVEKGRHKNIPREQRTCPVCEQNVVEDETHFMLECTRYHAARVSMYAAVSAETNGWICEKLFVRPNKVDKMKALLGATASKNKETREKCHQHVMRYIAVAMSMRREHLRVTPGPTKRGARTA